MVFAFAVSILAVFVFLVGTTTIVIVERTRARHPSLKIYLILLAVVFAHWMLSSLVYFLGDLQLQPRTVADLLLFPGSDWWIALVSVPERFLLACEVTLTLLSCLASTRKLGGRRGRRRLGVLFVVLVVFFVGERLVNLVFWNQAPANAFLPWRSLWYSTGNTLTLLATLFATVQLIRTPKHVLYHYIGSSYRTLGWGLAFYLSLIFGLAVVGMIPPGNLLDAFSQSVWYLLVVSVLLVVLGTWNFTVGFRVLMTSLVPRESKLLHQPVALDRYGLSDREREIVDLLARGLVNKEVAVVLHLSESTIKNHIYNLYRKLGITNRGGLVRVLGEAAHRAEAPAP
jgi:DNA-binding CsgD family transcriptional regulator